MQKRLIIFDMDGTLIDSGNVITNTINFVRVNIGLDILSKDELLKNLNNPNVDSAKFFYGTKEFTDEQTELFTQYYDKHCLNDIVLYDGIMDLLDELSRYFTLTVATNASTSFAKKMIEHLNIDHYFDMIVGTTCVANPKPNPDMLIKTIKELKIESSEAILIGDSHKDSMAATAANMEHILVNWGFSEHDKTQSVNSIEELKNILIKLK